MNNGKIWISVLDEEYPGHDDPESPNYIPFSGFNMEMIKVGLKDAVKKMGLDINDIEAAR